MQRSHGKDSVDRMKTITDDESICYAGYAEFQATVISQSNAAFTQLPVEHRTSYAGNPPLSSLSCILNRLFNQANLQPTAQIPGHFANNHPSIK